MGDLRSQIRGSRFFERISLISVDCLAQLVEVSFSLGDGPARVQLQSILYPGETVNLDPLAKLVSDLSIEMLTPPEGDDSSSQNSAQVAVTSSVDLVGEKRFDKSAMLQAFKKKGLKLEAGAGAIHYSADRAVYLLLTSKRYARNDQQYWYAFKQTWVDLLERQSSFLVLGLEFKDYFIKIDNGSMLRVLPQLNKTVKFGGRTFWHLGIRDTENSLELLLPIRGQTLSLDSFKIKY